MAYHIICASHNRREKTLLMVARLKRSLEKTSHTITILDDGSSDGTTDALIGNYPDVEVLNGDGSFFWAKSMSVAEGHVVSRGLSDDDVLVWINDDVVLDSDAFRRMQDILASRPGSVVVGATRDPKSGIVTYAGFRRVGPHPLRFASCPPTSTIESIDTFNGNFVLVPAKVHATVGSIDGFFAHALADIDYGMRCKRSGVPVYLAPGTFGTCPRNQSPPRAPLLTLWRQYLSPKGGGHFRSMMHYLRRHAPFTFPIYMIWTYSFWWARQIFKAARVKTTE